jgi:hypothetical protein
MPWWSWIVLWVAVAALAALFVLYLGFRLYRGFLAVIEAMGDAGDALASVPGRPDDGYHATVGSGAARLPAVFRDPAEVRAERAEGKRWRALARAQRRVRRRASRGQPQLLRDLPHL